MINYGDRPYQTSLHVIEKLDDNYGGPARSVPMLCLGLMAQGMDCELFSVNGDKDSNSIIENSDLKWVKATPGYLKKGHYSSDLALILKNRILELQKSNTKFFIQLHSIWSYPSIVILELCKKYNVPYVVTPRSSLQLESMKKNKFLKQLFTNLFIKKLIKSAIAINVTSEQEKIEFLETFEHNNVITVPNGLDFKEFENLPSKLDSKNSFEINKDSKTILFLSRISSRKGLDLLFEAFIKIKNEHNLDVTLLIAGPKEEAKLIEGIIQQAEALSIRNNVKYVGMLKNNMRLKAFSAADIFVLPTKFENFGMAIAESLASNLPVVTTKNTPWTWIEDENLGVICNRTVDSIVKSILLAFSLSEKKINAHLQVSTRFDYRLQAQKFLDLLNQGESI